MRASALSTLTGNNRMMVTTIAVVLRTSTLADGSTPRGIQFPSEPEAPEDAVSAA